MNFKDEIEMLKNDRLNKEEEVINEIVDYFKKEFKSDHYKDYLKNRIKNEINRSRSELKFETEFWEYQSGCSETHFRCGGYEFKLDYKETEYKGVSLNDIQYKIGEKLDNLFIETIRDLGLNIISSVRHDNDSRYNYYRNYVIIGW